MAYAHILSKIVTEAVKRKTKILEDCGASTLPCMKVGMVGGGRWGGGGGGGGGGGVICYFRHPQCVSLYLG